MIKQGSRFGVKLKATAPSIHLIKTNVETEVSPIVGSEKQSEELVNYLLSEFESNPKEIWNSNIFGKSLHELVNEGLQTKLSKMPEDAQIKLQETLERIVNEGSRRINLYNIISNKKGIWKQIPFSLKFLMYLMLDN